MKLQLGDPTSQPPRFLGWQYAEQAGNAKPAACLRPIFFRYTLRAFRSSSSYIR
jgi:hypothetical protein